MNPSRLPCVAGHALAAAVASLVAWSAGGCAHAPAPGTSGPPPALEARLRIVENPAVFALFTMLNVAGYDDENSPEGMHPVRQAVRAAAARTTPAPLRQEVTAFTAAHPIDPWAYTVVVMTTTGPPQFAWTARWTPDLSGSEEFGRLAGLPALLRRFAAAVPLDSLAAAFRPEYRATIEAAHAAVVSEVTAVYAYLRTPGPAAGGAGGENAYSIVIPNLLLSHQQAFSFVLADTLYSVEGPQRHAGYNPHEFIHAVTNPLSYGAENRPLQAPAETLFALARRTSALADELKTLPAFLDECLVRAIALRYIRTRTASSPAAIDGAMLEEYRRGYLMERFFYDQLGAYEMQKQPFAAYYPALLRALNSAAELARWNESRR